MVETRASRSRRCKRHRNPSFESQGTPPLASRVPQNQNAQPEGNSISCLMPFFMSLQETQRQILQLIANQAIPFPSPISHAASGDDQLARKVTTIKNDDPTDVKHSSDVQKPVTFLTRSEVEAIVRKETGSSLSFSTELMPSFPRGVTTIPYPPGYKVPKFQKFDGRKGDSKGHVRRFLDLLGVFSYDSTLCLRGFSKSLIDIAYTWYANLKLGSLHDFEHLISLFSSKFFCAKARFSLVELGRVR